MNYYPFHIGDYVSATRHLSWDEDAAYRRLLDVYYTTEKPIPLDHRAACRLVMAQTEEQREAVKAVLSEFFNETSDGWINRRADEVITDLKEKQNKQRDKANKRWHCQNKERGNATALNTDAAACEVDANAMPPIPIPIPKENPPITPHGGDSPDEQVGLLPPVEPGPTCKAPVNGSPIAFKTFLARCKGAGQRPIADYQPVWDYAEKVGIPEEVVILCWQEFARRYGDGGSSEGKRYRDWRSAFRKCVEGNWFGIWALDERGQAVLTTKGRMAEKVNA